MNAVAEKPTTVQDTGYRCGICRQSYIDHEDSKEPKAKDIADKCCICSMCGKPILENDPKLGRGRSSGHSECWSEASAKREAANIAKARVDEKWAGPVFYGDKYYDSIDSLEENLLDDDVSMEDWPKFAHATKPVTVSIDGQDLLFNTLENNDIDSDFIDDLKGSDELLAAIKIFNEANIDSGFYTEDMNAVVPITPKEQL